MKITLLDAETLGNDLDFSSLSQLGETVFYKNTSKTKSYSYKDLYRIENEGDIFELKPIIRMHDQE